VIGARFIASIIGAATLAVLLPTNAALGARSMLAAPPTRTLVLYTVAESEQFLNTSDDRARGEGNNPFGNYGDTSDQAQLSGNGPFAGDESFFLFDIYTDSSLRVRAGTATLTCVYNFNKNAYCNATYELKDGTLIGDGPFSFTNTRFAFAVTGGTGRYTDLHGALAETPIANHAQRVVFTLS
jgi:hypothetical protein